MHGRAIYERLCQFAHCAVKKGMCKTVQMILCYIIGVCMSSCCREEKSVWWSYWVPGGPSWERFPVRGKISGRDSPQDWQGMVIQLYIHFIFIIFGKSNASYIYMSEYSFKNGTMHTCILMKCLYMAMVQTILTRRMKLRCWTPKLSQRSRPWMLGLRLTRLCPKMQSIPREAKSKRLGLWPVDFTRNISFWKLRLTQLFSISGCGNVVVLNNPLMFHSLDCHEVEEISGFLAAKEWEASLPCPWLAGELLRMRKHHRVPG